jgi:hypothetical protein
MIDFWVTLRLYESIAMVLVAQLQLMQKLCCMFLFFKQMVARILTWDYDFASLEYFHSRIPLVMAIFELDSIFWSAQNFLSNDI